MNIFDRLSDIAKARGTNMTAVIRKINITEAGFYAMKRNGNIKLKTLEAMVDELGVSLEYFFGDDMHLTQLHENIANEKKGVYKLTDKSKASIQASVEEIEQLLNDIKKEL